MKKILAIFAALLFAFVFAVSGSAEGNDLVFNGDFELLSSYDDGHPEGWTFHSYETEADESYFGSYAICENDVERGVVVHFHAEKDDDVALYQTISVEPDTVYTISCYVRTEGVLNGAGANIALREIIARSEPVLDTEDWQLVSLTGRTAPDQKTLTVSCRLGGYSAVSTGDAWFDGFTVEKAGDPDEAIPFYSSSQDKPSGEEDDSVSSKAILVTVLVLLAALAICIIAVVMLLRRKKGAAGTSPLPDPGSAPINASDPDYAAVRGHAFTYMGGGVMPGPTDLKLHFNKRDGIYITALTVVYAAIALFRLGSLTFPTNSWSGNTGDSIRIDFGRTVELSDVWQVSGISHTKYRLVTDNGEEIQFTENSGREYGHMFRWASINKNETGKTSATTGVTLEVLGGDTKRPKEADLVMLEMAFFDKDGKRIDCTADGSAAALFDEQDTVPAYSSYMTGMYFDELYHARTALEHINNSTVYEWTHPPLGKLLVAVGILVFGMKPFGWRIVGTLFGIAMVPIMYCFGKRITKRSEVALFTAFLFTFDFMHFTQTRIATIDGYGVFFILLMTYFMYNFMCMDIGDSTSSMMKQLALSGLFFGLGCASKWIDIYTGAALAILFFTKLVLMGVKSYRLARIKGAKYSYLRSKFWSRTVSLCCWCVIFFVILPVVIYSASYFRYYTAQWKPDRQTEIYNADRGAYDSPDDVKLGFRDAMNTYLNGVIGNQKSIFNYHSKLKSEHSASSTWWMWLSDLRPTWFYSGGSGNPNGYRGTISSFGNPAVWILCTRATLMLAIVSIFIRKRITLETYFIFICLGSSLLPWVLVSRSTYAYHFFASVPYIVLASGYLIGYLEDADEVRRKKRNLTGGIVPMVKYAWMIIVFVLFVVFYPVISGLEVPVEYISALQWVPFHKIVIQDSQGEVLHTYRIGWRFLDYEPGTLKDWQLTTITLKK